VESIFAISCINESHFGQKGLLTITSFQIGLLSFLGLIVRLLANFSWTVVIFQNPFVDFYHTGTLYGGFIRMAFSNMIVSLSVRAPSGNATVWAEVRTFGSILSHVIPLC
jgi:hypothetical protein